MGFERSLFMVFCLVDWDKQGTKKGPGFDMYFLFPYFA